MFINLSGKNLICDVNTVIANVRHLGGKVERIPDMGFFSVKFITPAMSYYVIPAEAQDSVFSVNENIFNALYRFSHNKGLHNNPSHLVVHFVNFGLPYRAFEWDEIYRRNNVLTLHDGLPWDYMSIIRNCPLYSKFNQKEV